MVSTLMHIVWSATSSKVLREKNLFRFLFLGLLLDFDFIIDFFFRRPTDHRDYFHNIFFISAALIALWLWDKKKNTGISKSAFAAFSMHIFLDFFDGAGVPLFFPISGERLLLYPMGQAYGFPLKLFWEGNAYFTASSLAILLASVWHYKKS